MNTETNRRSFARPAYHPPGQSAAVNESQLTPGEVNLRLALDLPITATQHGVHFALVRKKIDLARSRQWNIPVDQTPK